MAGRGIEVRTEGRGSVVVWIAIATLALASIWVLPRVEGSAHVAKLTLILAGITLALIAAGVRSFVRSEVSLHVPWVFLGGLPLFVASLISLASSSNSAFSLASLVVIVLYVAFGLLVANVARTEHIAHGFLGALLAGASLVAFFGLLQYAGIFSNAALTPVDRVTATFGNRNFLGSLAGILAFPAVGLYLAVRRWWLRALVWIAAVLFFFTPFLVQQTGVAAALVVGLVFLLLGFIVFGSGRALRAQVKSIGLIAAAIVVGVGAGLAFWFAEPQDVVADTGGSVVQDLWAANYGTHRAIDWSVAWEMFERSPWTGVGLGNYKVHFLDAKTEILEGPDAEDVSLPIWRAEQAHNDYLQLIAELGILGMIALAACLALTVATFWMRMRALPNDGRRVELLFLLAGVVVACAHALVSFPFHLPVSALAVVVLLGLASSDVFGPKASFQLRLRGDRARVVAFLCFLLLGLTVFGLGRELFARVSLSRGLAVMETGDLDRAATLLERSVSSSPITTEALFWLSTVDLHRAGQAEDQASYTELLLSATDLATANLDAYPTEDAFLQVAGVALNTGDFDLVRSATAALLASNPRAEFARSASSLLISADIRSGEVDRAEAAIHQLIADEPEYVHAYLLLAMLRAQQGDAAGERDAYEQGVWAMQAGLARIDGAIEGADGTERARLLEERAVLLENLDLLLTAFSAATETP